MPRSRSPLKIILACLAGILALLIIVVLCLPMYFSSAAGTKKLSAMISGRTGFQVQIDKLSLNWFSQQKIQGLRAAKPEDQMEVLVKEIDAGSSLWRIVFAKDIGQVQVIGFDLKMAKPFSAAAAKLKPRTVSKASFAPQIALAKIELPVKGHVEMKEGRVSFNPPGATPISFDHLNLSLDLKPNDELFLALNGTTSPQGKIAIKATATQLKSPYPNLTAESTIEQLPVQGIDQLVSLFHPAYSGLLYDFLGPTINLGLHLTASAGNFDLRFNAASALVNAYAATQSVGGTLSLKGPAEFDFNLTPALLQKLSKLYPALSPFTLAVPVSFKTTVEKFSCPIPKNGLDLQQASLQAAMTSSDMQLALGNRSILIGGLNFSAGSTALGSDVNFNLATTLQKKGSLNIHGNVQSPFSDKKTGEILVQAQGLPTDLLSGIVPDFANLLGPSANIDGKLAFQGKDNQIYFHWDSENLQIPKAGFSLNDTLTLQTPCPFTFTPNPQWVNGMLGGSVQLAKATPIQGILKTVSVPLSNIASAALEMSLSEDQLILGGSIPLSVEKMQAAVAVNQMKVSGQILLSQIILQNQGKQLALQNIALPFQWDEAGKTASIQLSAAQGKGTLQGQFTLSNFSLDQAGKAELHGSLDTQNLSTALLDIFVKKGLSDVAGPVFNTQLKVQSNPDKQQFGLKWSSQNLKADLGFVVSDELQLQGANNQVQFILTPASYKALDKLMANQTNGSVPFEIKEASTFTLSLSKLSLPVTKTPGSRIPDINFDLSKLQINLTGKDPGLAFYDQSLKETILLQNLTFALNKIPQNPLVLSFDCMVKTEGASSGTKSGSLSMNGKLLPTDLAKLTCSLNLKAQQLPSRALDIFARAKGKTNFPFTTMFGNVINATANVDLKDFTGPISLSLNTPLVRAELDGGLKNGVLTLKDTMRGQLKLTPENSRLLLGEVNPLGISYMYSHDPITLEIPAEGFSCPLYPSDLSKINIPKGKLELGKIFCRNEGNVNIALGLLKFRQLENNDELILWLAPLDFSIKQGLVDIERTEILVADTFDVCFWGNINMVTDELDMVLGLTAQALAKAFALTNLPKDYVLWIPLRGKADNVKIDSGKATAKIALLLASQKAEIAGALGANPAGVIIGGLLKKAITLPDMNAKTPPAKHPFPWENSKAKPSPSSSPQEKKFKATDKPLKQILKLIK